MRRFKRILFLADGAPGEKVALERAVSLARDNKATLTVIEVSPGPPPKLPSFGGALTPKKLGEILKDEGRRHLQSLITDLAAEDVETDSKVLVGAPFVEVVREVVKGEHDLLITAAEEEKSATAMLFGSTDLHLMRKCPCPVWIMKSSRRQRYARILAAVDISADDEVEEGLNRLILDLAVSVAQVEECELDIVHAWSLYAERALRSRNILPKPEIKRMVEQTREQRQRRLQSLLDHYPMAKLKVHIHLVKGEPGEVIPALAEERQTELIVMGTVARTGLAGFFIGNAAERVLDSVDCSVLAVKPQGFVTPVALSD